RCIAAGWARSCRKPVAYTAMGTIVGEGPMGRFAALVKFGSKLVLEIMPSVAATVIGGYLLTQLNFSRTPEPPAPHPPAAPAPPPRSRRAAGAGPAGGGVPRGPREPPEGPAGVGPVAPAAAAPATEPVNPPAPVTAQLPAAMDSMSPNEPVDHAAAPSRP